MLRFRYLLVAAFVATFVMPMSASATHNADLHSPNMSLEWSLPEGPTRTHSDIAFWGTTAVAGNYDGFRIFNTETHELYVNKLCRGSQGDVSLWEHNGRLLLFLSNDTPQVNGANFCSPVRSSDDTSNCGPRPNVERTCFEGIRIFDITNRANPVLITGVYTECGSHTHTLVPDLNDNRVLLYIASAGGANVRCVAPHAKISIVGVPLDAPENARVIATPPVSAQSFGSFTGCHDITVFLAIQKALASCQSEAQIWDISDPAAPGTVNPVRIDTAVPPFVNYWHSAEFTWDGQYVVIDDESFTGRCAPGNDGMIRIYRVSDAALMSSYMIPRNQGTAYCSVHNGNIVPTSSAYLLVAAWYAGGTSVIDFTNPAAPVEVGYYDASVGRGLADTWSSYWYNGKIYANDIVRGVDVFQLTPSPSAATWTHLNAQTQEGLMASPIASMTPLARLARPAHRSARLAKTYRKRVATRGRGWKSRARVARTSKRR